MRIPDSQPFVPVILGGDIGTYSLAREFHEAYGVVSAAVPAQSNGVLEHSVAVDVRPAGTMVDESAVVAHLLALGAELTGNGANPRPLLLCGSLDLQVMLITRHRARLEPLYTIPYVPLELMERAALKQNFYALCAELGVPHPVTIEYDAGAHPRPLPAELPFPLIGKPSDSSAWVRARFAGKQKVHSIADRAELEDLLERIASSGYEGTFILQESIPGGDENMRLCTYFCDAPGSVRLAAYGEVVVEEHAPIVLGNSAAIVVARDDEVIAQGRRILEHLGWTGFGMFDAKLDPRDGVVKFFELNPRLGRNHYYVTAAGHNAARYYVRSALGPDFEPSGLPEGMAVADAEVLYTVLPAPLLKRHLRGPVGGKAARLLRARRAVNPLRYRAERHPRRLLYLAISAANQFRKYAKYPPRTQ
ncbi:carbamoyl-phosphate synthase [Zafaria sp. Z1313]|uniref:carboxylate--amine ligase n=1 Tax=unclassified Zafaria TaxID=2828765 RepID=UPI002E77C696|nr:carbamoyl-phosphate synthase [Zafaria sp. J156]MEE1621443.1 carbamoyl-phosphate synthase [Zafaria sp. J156]